MAEQQKIDDPYRDSVGSPETGVQTDDAMPLAPGVVPDTDPTVNTYTYTGTIPASTALQAQTTNNVLSLPDVGMTVTSVTYTPSGAQAAPTVGNSRTWTVKDSAGNTIASNTFSSTSSALVSGTPVTFTVNNANPAQGAVSVVGSVAGTGIADPGGTLTVNTSF